MILIDQVILTLLLASHSFQSPSIGYKGLMGFGLSSEECSKLQRFGPAGFNKKLTSSSSLDTIGFFIALFEKKV